MVSFSRRRKGLIVLRKKGFTLVELLVVISIIALLLSILMPSLNKVRVMGRRVACQAELKQWAVVFQVYAESNNGRNHNFWPHLSIYGGTETYDDSLKKLAVELFKPIYQDKKLLMCPASSRTGTMGAQPWIDSSTGTAGSYGENLWATCPAWPFTGTAFDSKYFWNTTFAKGSNRVPLFMDSVCQYMFPTSTDSPPFAPNAQFGSPVCPMKYACVDRHSNGIINILFLDLSVRSVGLKELWTLKWSKNFRTDNIYTKEGGATNDTWRMYPWMKKFKQY
jgi:prepilin-type N-terminal cleavage/methylation domain-containing protein/prepilin-type processing-associated H-X9-DG protein